MTPSVSRPSANLRNTYILPKAPYLQPILVCGVIMALSSQRSVIGPGSPVYDHMLRYFSLNALKYVSWVQSGLFYFLFGAHAIETVLFAKRLGKHGVRMGCWAWWKWMATCFVGGKYCYMHFDQEVGKFV